MLVPLKTLVSAPVVIYFPEHVKCGRKQATARIFHNFKEACSKKEILRAYKACARIIVESGVTVSTHIV